LFVSEFGMVDRWVSARARLWKFLPAVVGCALILASSPARADIEGLVGGAVGVSSVGDGSRIAASPLLGAKWDPLPWTVRPTIGIFSMPTYFFDLGEDFGSVPALMGELGLAVGNSITRLELVGHGGLYAYGAAVHFTHLPVELSPKVRSGFELRAGWFGPSALYGGIAWKVRFGPFGTPAEDEPDDPDEAFDE
jgi:hypothetical protein